jgi:hypothetical protein
MTNTENGDTVMVRSKDQEEQYGKMGYVKAAEQSLTDKNPMIREVADGPERVTLAYEPSTGYPASDRRGWKEISRGMNAQYTGPLPNSIIAKEKTSIIMDWLLLQAH